MASQPVVNLKNPEIGDRIIVEKKGSYRTLQYNGTRWIELKELRQPIPEYKNHNRPDFRTQPMLATAARGIK